MDYQPYIDAGIGTVVDKVVAERLGFTNEWVRQVRCRMGLPAVRTPRPPARIVALRSLLPLVPHCTQGECSALFGVSASVVHREAVAAGVVLRDGRYKYDWSTVDWNQNNVDIAEQIGAGVSVVAVRRMLKRKAGELIPRAPYWVAPKKHKVP